MNQTAAGTTSEQKSVTPGAQASPANRERGERLATDDGNISVAEGVVQKIAGKACREVAGVHAMGTSGRRALGASRERVLGSPGPGLGQGVGAEAGEAEAAPDQDSVVESGVGRRELRRSIQGNV